MRTFFTVLLVPFFLIFFTCALRTQRVQTSGTYNSIINSLTVSGTNLFAGKLAACA